MTRSELSYFYHECICSEINSCKPTNPPPFDEVVEAWETGRLVAHWGSSCTGHLRIVGNHLDPRYDRDMMYRLKQ